ncbi:hypothetical protein OAP63_17210 [Vibrio sp.]|uniref:Lipoprotein n=1 Tax=Vibrio viridaestus TaxID=2487322 RepID=A0A3N9TH30_9VIBR|nr:hypothetical protein [Vibrio viridaestus]MDC0612472.1 hypothetical protein [Vibrio sp.]RQW63499.1 hypothetical protein EES38_09640 [Vibrio viridaestus]
MKKVGLVIALALALVGCKNGFEGEYSAQTGANNELLSNIAQYAPQDNIVIGEDYIDIEGKRTQFDKIFERSSGGKRYLVFERNNQEVDVWKIVDDKTLIQEKGLLNITYHKVK